MNATNDRGARQGAPSGLRRRRRSRALTAVCAALLAPLVAWTAALLDPGASRLVDLLANLCAQLLLATLVLMLALAALRRWRLLGAAALLVVVQCAMLSRHRAAILPRPGLTPSVTDTQAARPPGTALRVLLFNASRGQTSDAFLDDLRKWDPDIVVIAEPSPGVMRSWRALVGPPVKPIPLSGASPDGPFFEPGAHWQRGFHLPWPGIENDPALVGDVIIASRWGLTPIAGSTEPYSKQDPGTAVASVIANVPSAPGGQVLIVGLHPPSPRNSGRWELGNEMTRRAAALVEDARSRGTPVLVIGDLNSTPTGYRSRLLAGAGLKRAKPLMRLEGTWPTREGLTTAVPADVNAPNPADHAQARAQRSSFGGNWPLTIAIDDALISDEFGVVSWTRSESRGSDHWPIVIDLTWE